MKEAKPTYTLHLTNYRSDPHLVNVFAKIYIHTPRTDSVSLTPLRFVSDRRRPED